MSESSSDDISAEINALRLQQVSLNTQMNELRARQNALTLETERRKQEELLNRSIQLRITMANSISFATRGDYRPDVVEALRKIPSRRWDSISDANVFAMRDLDMFTKIVSELKNVELTYEPKVKDYIDVWKNAPNFRITLIARNVKIACGPRADSSIPSSVPGSRWNGDSNSWIIPLPEAYRLLEIFKEDEKVIWSNEAKELAISQLESRTKLNEVALSTDVELDIEFSDKRQLRPFQKVGVKFGQVSGGKFILADAMGLGKTTQYIALALAEKWTKNVIICPANLKPNWMREIKAMTGDDAYICSGLIPDKYTIARLIANTPKWTIINYDILGKCSKETEKSVDERGVRHEIHTETWVWAELIKLMRADSLCIDEAHKIKNPATSRTKGAFKLVDIPHIIELTGTPVQNRPSELWSLVHMLYPDTFPSYETFIRQYTIPGTVLPRNTNELRALLQPIMLRRLKSDVMKELPAINRMVEYHELGQIARDAYELVLEGIYVKMSEWDPTSTPSGDSVANILVEMLRLKQICASDKVSLTIDTAKECYDSHEESEKNKKVIIFSQFKDPIKEMAQELGDECVSFTGDTPQFERMQMVDRFQHDSAIRYLCATTKVAGEGLTMTAAGTVIFNDLGWTPAEHEQCEGRAYGRLNDAHGIDSYYIVAENSIEEKIQRLLAAKMHTIDQVVEGHASDRISDSVAMNIISELRAEMGKRKRK